MIGLMIGVGALLPFIWEVLVQGLMKLSAVFLSPVGPFLPRVVNVYLFRLVYTMYGTFYLDLLRRVVLMLLTDKPLLVLFLH